MTIEIRAITESQLGPWISTIEGAFGVDSHEGDVERWQATSEARRVLGAFDNDEIVGGAAAFSFSLTVPGPRRVPAAGVTMVGVLPTHRRQGILRRMMTRQLADARAEGEPLAVLWASEGVIYQRFGYGLTSLNGSIDVERARATFRSPQPPSGRISFVDQPTAQQALPQAYEAAARQTPGFFARDAAWWEHKTLADPEHWRNGASRKHFALHRRGAQPTGYVIYRVKEEWSERGPRSELRVVELIAVDQQAERELWEFVFSVDLVYRVIRGVGPAEPALLLQLAQPELLGARLGAGLWLRILDVPAALAGRGYEHDGELTLQVNDEFMPEAAGRWRMVVRDGLAHVEPTSHEPDLELETNDLATVYLGAFSFADLRRAGRGRERVEGATRRADGLFASPIKPWCPQIF